MKKSVNPFVYDKILESNIPNSTIPAWLNETYAQCYEDVIIESFLRAHFKNKPYKAYSKTAYVEIGANHPVCTSSTYLWYTKYGVRGVLVEANPALINSLRKFRPGDTILNAAITNKDVSEIDLFLCVENEISSLDDKRVLAWKDFGIQGSLKVPAMRIDSVLELVNNVAETILLTIDVEGLDLQLLRDINFEKYRPLVIQTEPSDDLYPGTFNGMVELMQRNNYMLLAETDVNIIFVDKNEII